MRFDLPFLIWLIFAESIWIIYFICLTISDLTEFWQVSFFSSFPIQFDTIFRFTWLPLHPSVMPFLIWLKCSYSIWLIISDTILLSISDLIWLSYPIWFVTLHAFESPFTIWLSYSDSIWLITYFNKFSYLIQLPLNPFNLTFMIWIIFYDSIWLIISDSIWFIYSVWFNIHWIHSIHHLWFDSAILIIRFNLTQLSNLIRHTACIWITIYDLTQLFWFNLTHHLF